MQPDEWLIGRAHSMKVYVKLDILSKGLACCSSSSRLLLADCTEKGCLTSSIDNDTISKKGKRIAVILRWIRANPTNVRYADLARVCDAYFGRPRQHGSSHRVYKTPWTGDPRVNIQNDQGKAKTYQVRQVLKAIDRLEEERGS